MQKPAGDAQRDRREKQLLRVSNDLPALQVKIEPEALPFFLGSEIRKLWRHPDCLADVLFDLGPEQVMFVWQEALLFITFLVYVEVPPAFYSNLSPKLFALPNSAHPVSYRDAEMPYSRDQLYELGLLSAKSARWEEQYSFIPATLVFNSPEQWLQRIPNKLIRLPFIERDETHEHGGYGDVGFFKVAPEYVIDQQPLLQKPTSNDPQSHLPLVTPTIVPVVAVKSFHARDDGLKEVKNMKLLKQGLASEHSISLHNVIIEHGQGPSSNFFIIFPRAELGDLEQFLRGGARRGNMVDSSGNNELKLAKAMLQQCSGLAGALKFLHRGFPVGTKLFRGAHMDLKPNNIVMFSDGGPVGRWKLCDFGISVFKEEDMGMAGLPEDGGSAAGRVLDDYTQMTMNTRARRGVGSYQAPEVHDSWETFWVEDSRSGRVGRSSDVWSFGCIFTEILAFALGGHHYVHDFRVFRKQKIYGTQDDYFFSRCPLGTLGTDPLSNNHFVLRSQVPEWLAKHCRHETGLPVWKTCWAAHLIKILQVSPERRPSAEALEGYVVHIWTDTLESRCEMGQGCMDFERTRARDRQQLTTPTRRSYSIPEVVVSPTTALAQADFGAAPSRPFIVPVSSNPLFTGRENEISRIKEFFFEGDGSTQKRLVLTGLGGVGKTQIATAFAYDAYNEHRYNCVLWFFSVEKQELVKSFTQAARTLGLYPEVASEGERAPSDLRPNDSELPPMAMALMQWLSRDQSTKWLLVFDNVDDLDSFNVSTFFPNVPWGDILITSRNKLAHRLGYHLEIDVMNEDEAVDLLRKCARQEYKAGNDALVRRLAKTLGCLPLALDQAGAYVYEQYIDLQDYLELYGEGRAELLRHRPPQAVWGYREETVFTTWEISYNVVQKSNKLASKLINLVAFFHSDGVPLALITALAQPLSHDQRLLLPDFCDFITTRKDYSQLAGELGPSLQVSKLETQSAIGKLASLSLVYLKKPETVQTISTHPLVHFWLRERQTEASRIENARLAICITLHALINAYDTSQYTSADIIYPYLFICLETVHSMPGLLNDTELHKLGACIIAIDAWVPVSHDHGTLHRADRFFDLVAARRPGAEWTIPEAMLAVRRALKLKRMGHRRECADYCTRYLESFNQRTRFDRTFAARMAHISAPCFYRVGDYDGAENMYTYADDSLDPSGTMVARKKLVLGAIKIDRGLPEEAERVLQECEVELRRGIGPEHFLQRVWYQLMALCYIGLGRLGQAEETVLMGLQGRLEMLDERKIEFSFSDYELVEVYARVLSEQRRYDRAREFLTDLLRKSASPSSSRPKPARILAELSMVLVQLDEATYSLSMSLGKGNRFRSEEEEMEKIDTLMAEAHLKFKEAAASYELEWNRGTWVFKHFPDIMVIYEGRIGK